MRTKPPVHTLDKVLWMLENEKDNYNVQQYLRKDADLDALCLKTKQLSAELSRLETRLADEYDTINPDK